MRPVTRREVLVLGGLGTLGIVAGGAGLAWQSGSGSGNGSGFAPAAGQDLAEPSVVRSANGVLSTSLRAAAGPATVAGRSASVLSYNGGVPGPTLTLKAGDRLEVSLQNQLGSVTNLHVHGLLVSPQGNSDNVFVAVESGASFDYDYQLPPDHPPGVYWYHPHHHGMVADQVFGGLYGAIIVEDPQPIPVSRDRVLIISDITLDGAGQIAAATGMQKMVGREGDLVLVNGQSAPQLTAQAGERERWRIINACAGRYLRLSLDGQRLQLLGMDSGRLAQPQDVKEIVLAPGNRADLLVTAAAGTAVLRTLPVDRGNAMGGMGGGAAPSSTTVDLASFRVGGGAALAVPAPVPDQPQPRDLRTEPVTGSRELTFAMGMGGMGASMMSFTIDGKAFDAARVDTAVRAGSIEEWTLTNTSTMDHPVHLHVWPMQVVEQGGTAVTDVIWRDVVNVPRNSSVRVRVAFDRFAGKSVYHCHILDHEDQGMMGVIEVA